MPPPVDEAAIRRRLASSGTLVGGSVPMHVYLGDVWFLLGELDRVREQPAPEPEDPERVLTVAECQEWLRVSRATIYELLSVGALPSFKIGASRRVRAEDVRTYIADELTREAERVGLYDWQGEDR